MRLTGIPGMGSARGFHMRVMGADPGLQGGIAILDSSNPALPIIEPMPTLKLKKGKGIKTVIDEQALQRWLSVHTLDLNYAYLERPGFRPGQSVQSGATVAENFGFLRGLLFSHGVPTVIVAPQTWMKKLHEGIDKSLDSKSRSLIIAKRRFPSVNFVLPGCRRDHDGMAEAALIALFGLSQETANRQG